MAPLQKRRGCAPETVWLPWMVWTWRKRHTTRWVDYHIYGFNLYYRVTGVDQQDELAAMHQSWWDGLYNHSNLLLMWRTNNVLCKFFFCETVETSWCMFPFPDSLPTCSHLLLLFKIYLQIFIFLTYVGAKQQVTGECLLYFKCLEHIRL